MQSACRLQPPDAQYLPLPKGDESCHKGFPTGQTSVLSSWTDSVAELRDPGHRYVEER
jgi:hypothetical protein